MGKGKAKKGASKQLIFPRRLLVEGVSEIYALSELIETNGIQWEDQHGSPIVKIKSYGGIKNFNSDFLIAQLDLPKLEILGLIVDADNKPEQRWESVRKICQSCVSEEIKDLPEGGLICTAHNTANQAIRFGIWMMPDNRMRGMLETFLAYLIPDSDPLWEYAQTAAQQAKLKGAPFKAVHTDKANIHTW